MTLLYALGALAVYVLIALLVCHAANRRPVYRHGSTR
jgi:hypothetical protein